MIGAFNQSVSSGLPAHARGKDRAGGVMLFAIQSLAEAASSAATKVGILRKENRGRRREGEGGGGGIRREEEGGREGERKRRRDGEREKERGQQNYSCE